MISLKLGFMSNKELAAWSHKSEKYLTDKKRAWCEKNLSKYAEYRDARGGVYITKIIMPVYATKPKKQIEKNFEKYWGTKEFKADTCKNCLDKMRGKLENIEIKETTLYDYTCQVKREMFGIPIRDRYPGYKGKSRFVYCKINSSGEAERFTPEEE